MWRLLLLAVCLFHLAGNVDCRRKRRVKDVNLQRAEALEVGTVMLCQQLLRQQFYLEAISQTEGNSGITMVMPPFKMHVPPNKEHHPDYEVLPAIHSHPDMKNFLGLSDLGVVLNGIYFRTGSLHYQLRRHTKRHHRFGSQENIPMPRVPHEVSKLRNIDDQISEMRLWFRAFHNQDHSKRDYRKYFKPVLCYLEGTWMKRNKRKLEKRFHAKKFRDLVEQVLYSFNLLFHSL